MKRTDRVDKVTDYLEKQLPITLNMLNLLDSLREEEREIYVDKEEDIGIVLIHVGYMNYLHLDDPGRVGEIVNLLDTFGDGMGFSGVVYPIREALKAYYDEI